MSGRSPTSIGRVRNVLGSTVTVALDAELAGIAPIYRGHLQPVGQIGALVRIPQGMIDLIGTVSTVGIAEQVASHIPSEAPQRDERWIEVQLLGEIDRATQKFQRGIGTYPGLDDLVHFATPQDITPVFPKPDEQYLRLGRLSSADEIAVCLDAAKLVVRHSVVVGSTGSGKTNAVASILQNFVNGGWNAANIVVIDPHGEYSRALEGRSAMRSVLGDDANRLRVPFWALPALDILKVLAGSVGGATFNNRFIELVTQGRREFARGANWLALDPSIITADTPVPFDIRAVWHKLDYENRETRNVKANAATVCQEDPGNAATLTPARFTPYNQGGAAPFQGPLYGTYGRAPDQLRFGLADPQLRFFLEPLGTAEGPDPLIDTVQAWLGYDSPVSVLNFAGVPAFATDVAIGAVMNLIFEISFNSGTEEDGIGSKKPVLIVLEEAHRYLGDAANQICKDAANRIAREGRKYGVGMMLVTQRPKELPDTALAQCGTVIALRLSNTEDQSTVRGALPDAVAGLAAVLPSLRTGEALVSGESLLLPARIQLDRPNPRPRSDDPDLSAWRGQANAPNVAPALSRWRRNYEAQDD